MSHQIRAGFLTAEAQKSGRSSGGYRSKKILDCFGAVRISMKLRDVSAIAEIIAAAAVVISLLYVAGEVEDNTRSQDAATIQAISRDVRAVAASVPVEARTKYRSGQALTPSEEYEYGLFVFSALRAYESWWLQRELGTLSDEVFAAYITSMDVTLEDSFSRQWWRDRPVTFVSGFSAFVDQHIAANPLPK